MHEWTIHIIKLFITTPSLRTNKLIYFFFCLTHPRHYAENSLRLLEEGDGVEGSSGFPGSVCLHPLHGPPSRCTASSLVLPSSQLLVRMHGLCGAPGNRHGKSPNPLLLLLSPLQRGWMLVSPWLLGAQPPLFSRGCFSFFYLTSKSPVVLSLDIRAQDAVGYVSILMMLSPFQRRSRWRTSERASVVTPRPERSSSETLPVKARSENAHVFVEVARLCF